jgi:hypothetical protein
MDRGGDSPTCGLTGYSYLYMHEEDMVYSYSLFCNKQRVACYVREVGTLFFTYLMKYILFFKNLRSSLDCIHRLQYKEHGMQLASKLKILSAENGASALGVLFLITSKAAGRELPRQSHRRHPRALCQLRMV